MRGAPVAFGDGTRHAWDTLTCATRLSSVAVRRRATVGARRWRGSADEPLWADDVPRHRPTVEEVARGRARVAELRSRIRGLGAPRCRPCSAERHADCHGNAATGICGCDCPEGAEQRQPKWVSSRIVRYRFRPVEVDAIHYDGSVSAVAALTELVAALFGETASVTASGDAVVIDAPAGSRSVAVGDWVVHHGGGRLATYADRRFGDLFDAAVPDAPEPESAP